MSELLISLRRHAPRIAISLLIMLVFFLHVAGVLNLGFISRLEHLAYDARVRATMPEDVDKRVVIVDIDEKSLTAQGRWPWTRDRIKALIDNLFDHYGIKLLAKPTEFILLLCRHILPVLFSR